MIYLDNAATTFPKPEAVYIEMDRVNRNLAVNAGRGSYKLARTASELIAETKSLLRRLIGVDVTSSVIFTPSITVAMNQIVHGLDLPNNSNVYVSPYEHNAVARTLNYLAKEKAINIIEMPLKEDTLEIDIEKLKYLFSKNIPAAVFCTHVSNVTGYILPVDNIFCESKKYGCINILDTAQSLGLLSVDAVCDNVDLVAFTAHKTIYGPFGIGGFINVSGVRLKEFLTGGTGSDSLNLDMPQNSEGKYEPASANIVAIAGLNAALKVLDPEKTRKIEKELTEYLVNGLDSIEGVHIFLPENRSNYIGIVSIVLEGYSSDDVGTILDEDFDIAVRTGYHCAPYIHKYLKDEKYLGTVRIGVSQFTTIKDLDILLRAIEELRC